MGLAVIIAILIGAAMISAALTDIAGEMKDDRLERQRLRQAAERMSSASMGNLHLFDMPPGKMWYSSITPYNPEYGCEPESTAVEQGE